MSNRLIEEASILIQNTDFVPSAATGNLKAEDASLNTDAFEDDAPVIFLYNLKEYADYNDFMTKLEAAKTGSELIDLVERLPSAAAATGKSLTYNRIIVLLNREGKLSSLEYPPRYSEWFKKSPETRLTCMHQ